jgi:hypothetical protein
MCEPVPILKHSIWDLAAGDLPCVFCHAAVGQFGFEDTILSKASIFFKSSLFTAAQQAGCDLEY